MLVAQLRLQQNSGGRLATFRPGKGASMNSMTLLLLSSKSGQSRGRPAVDDCLLIIYNQLQIIKEHDVDGAVNILFEHAGPLFKEQVIKWGAVHADKRRYKYSWALPSHVC